MTAVLTTERSFNRDADVNLVTEKPDTVDAAIAAEWSTRRTLARRDLFLSVVTPLVLFSLWEYFAQLGWIDVRLFPAPSMIAMRAGRMIISGELFEHLIATSYRLALGFIFGSLSGIAVAMLMGRSRALNAALGPLFSALYALPKIAILPLLLLIFGLNDTARVLAVSITIFFVVQISTLAGIQQIDARLLEAARSYGATGWKELRYVIFPAVLPSIFTGLRTATGLGVVIVTAVEFVASNEGLGFLIWNSWQLFQAEKMYVGLGVVALLGAAVTYGVVGLERVSVRWRHAEAVTKTSNKKEGAEEVK